MRLPLPRTPLGKLIEWIAHLIRPISPSTIGFPSPAWKSCYLSIEPEKEVNHSRIFVDPETAARFSELFEPFHLKPQGVLLLPKGEVVGNSAVILTNRREIVPDPFPGRELNPKEIASAEISCISPADQCRLLVSLIDPFSHNYFHWLIDILPRLRWLSDLEPRLGVEVALLIPAWMTDWQKDSLKILAKDRRQIPHRVCRQIFRIQADHLVVSTPSRFNGEEGSPFAPLDPGVCRWLRSSFLKNGSQKKLSEQNSKIYISRKRAGSRRILNETDVVSALEKHGFKTHELEGMTIENQVHLFSEAKIIVAAHGSALTNLVFARDANVVELFAEGHGIRSDYLQICLALEHNYRAMICGSENEENDFQVDLDRLLKLISTLS